MKQLKFLLLFTCLLIPNLSFAGLELVCKGRQVQTNNKIIYVNCSNRKEFIETLGAAWQTLRKNYIGGTTEDLCWEAYKNAKVPEHTMVSFPAHVCGRGEQVMLTLSIEVQPLLSIP